ncbi:ABC transporter ATP-binding protein [Dehalococcoidia bacterium]|nr:ABC transporter ATP-binding protein [Dehalococcoidia bacterium]
MGREEPVIEVVGLTKSFSGVLALDDVSFNVFKGDVFGCIGPNGAGKTTAIRCILDLLKPSKGEAKVFGESSASSLSRYGRKIGTALENPGLFEELTGEENLELYSHILRIAKEERKRRIGLLLSFVGLEGKRREKIAAYSHGMKKRLIPARALLNDPEILIFDEITSGLDPEQKKTFYELIRHLREEGKTIFFSSHVLSEVEGICSRIIILREGKAVFCDTLENLFLRFGRYIVRARFSDVERVDGIGNLPFVKNTWVEDKNITIFVSIDNIEEVSMKLGGLGLFDLSVTQIKLDDIYATIFGLEDKTRDSVKRFRESFARDEQ